MNFEQSMRVVFVKSGVVLYVVDRWRSKDRGRRALSFQPSAIDQIELLSGAGVVVAEMADLLLP
ncbi:MAG: hypothetical protein RL412_959 [Pseudomonadota bacterium]